MWKTRPSRCIQRMGAGDTGGDGVEQALEFGLGRCGDAVEPGRFVIERVGAGAGAGAHAQSGTADEEGGDRPVDDAQDSGEHRGAASSGG